MCGQHVMDTRMQPRGRGSKEAPLTAGSSGSLPDGHMPAAATETALNVSRGPTIAAAGLHAACSLGVGAGQSGTPLHPHLPGAAASAAA